MREKGDLFEDKFQWYLNFILLVLTDKLINYIQ